MRQDASEAELRAQHTEEVTDTGKGIDASLLDQVFERFAQGDRTGRLQGGLGLGLAIVRNLVELHGGTFELRSQLRKGTEAVVFFPKKRVLHRMAPLQPLGAERHRRNERRREQPAGLAEVVPRRVRRSVRQMLEAS